MDTYNTIILILFILACIADIITRILTGLKKQGNNQNNPMLENALSVSDLINDMIKSWFLFAQKQNWTNPDRMAYVVQMALALFPDSVKEIIGMPVADYVQQLYDQFTSSYKQLDKELAEKNNENKAE